MVDEPYAQPPPRGRSPERLPWEERQTLGFMPALVETIRWLATDPKSAFSRLRADGDYVSPLIFGLLISWAAMCISQVWSVSFSSLWSLGDVEALGFVAGFGVLRSIFLLAIYPALFVIALLIGSGLHHLVLTILGGLTESELGFEGTFKVAAYSMVSSLAMIVPLFGYLIMPILSMVLLFIGFQAVHRTSAPQALFAVLLPTFLCCACAVGLGLVFGTAILAAIAGLAGAASAGWVMP